MAPNLCYDRMEEVNKFEESKMGVKGLLDSGITSIPKIFIHPPEMLADLKPNPSQTSISIPVIDLANVDSKVHRAKIVCEVKEAASKWGFFQVINHGIAQSVLDSTLKAIKSFHELPYEVKSQYYMRDRYVSYACNTDLLRSNVATWYDTLQVRVNPDEIKIEKIPEICRKEVVAWEPCATMVNELLMELLCEGLGLEASKFKELTFDESRVMVCHYYPYCPQPELTFGIIPHTDPAVLNVLLQNEVQGLQVKHGDQWVDVTPVNGGLIVNVGDLLQIISNGEYKSVHHRVLANSHKEPRISVVQFFKPSKWKGDGCLGPLSELLSPQKPAIYRKFSRQEFRDNFFTKGLDSYSLIEKAKISY